MSIVKKLFITIVFLLFIAFSTNAQQKNFDIVVYGGTSAGISAAIQSSRLGKSVVLIEPTKRIGGLTTGGLGQTDIGNKQAIGGISREFYQNIKKHYDNPANWKWQKKQDYQDSGQTRTEKGEATMWTFEPSAALKVLQEMLAVEKNITLVYEQRLNRTPKGIRKKSGVIKAIQMENGQWYEGKMFIDATYEGDLMALAGISYTVGREANEEFGENLNGVQANVTSTSLTGVISRNGFNHNFVDGVDPYIEKGNPKSGLLPFIEKEHPLKDGTGDKRIQAYCYRMCLTNHPENRIPFGKPVNYNELAYELLIRNFEAGEKVNDLPWINSSMPNRKTDTNNRRGFSTDFIGQNYAYPEASYTERKVIAEKHLNYQKGLMWTLAYHPRIPKEVRDEFSKWGMCKDEFTEENGWQQQLYVREARRMRSHLVMNQRHCEALIIAPNSVGLAAYGMDSHHVQRYVTKDGFVKNEGNVESKVAGPFSIGYESIVPKENECKNLLVPVCLSATHIAFGSIRMEPVFMVLGQSAAAAAVLAIENKVSPQKLPYEKLREVLLKEKQRL
ncbi:MAG: FAD-dependent oxidoreductase [Spirosomataceae bacterium]